MAANAHFWCVPLFKVCLQFLNETIFLAENFQSGVVSCVDFEYFIEITILATIHVLFIEINSNKSYAEIEKMHIFCSQVVLGAVILQFRKFAELLSIGTGMHWRSYEMVSCLVQEKEALKVMIYFYVHGTTCSYNFNTLRHLHYVVIARESDLNQHR